MKKTKVLGLVTGISFFLLVQISGSEPESQSRLLRILLIAAGTSQVTLALMAHELENTITKK
jgi:hypothetical protein